MVQRHKQYTLFLPLDRKYFASQTFLERVKLFIYLIKETLLKRCVQIMEALLYRFLHMFIIQISVL